MIKISVLLVFLPLFSCFTVNRNESAISDFFSYPRVNPKATCQIDVRALLQRHPLLRNPSTREWVYPDNAGSSIITVATGTPIELDCPGSANVVAGTDTHSELVIATCVSVNNFRIGGQVIDFYTVICSRKTTSTARYTGNSCFGRGREIEVGWVFSDGHFIKEMTTCFDSTNREVLYSLFKMTHQIGDKATGGTRPAWTEGTFYSLGTSLNNLYPNAAQRTTVNRLVGLPDEDTTYVQPTGNYYLARGHLIAYADYIYHPQQETTFHYINSAPQWQTFNGFNWAYFEGNVRDYAARTGLDLEVLTGTYGISTLPHSRTGEPVELYLFADDNGNTAIPVPELFWKVVYSPVTQAGVAVLGLNNPFQQDVLTSVICDDIADQLTWLSFDRFNLQRGYMYACTVADLRKVIPHIPNYNVRSILN